jgi:site-specific DNA-cytosine methylase
LILSSPTVSLTFTRTTAYGSRVDVPGDIDLLVCGSACVDYSNLNAHKKDLDDKGESGSTFYAVLNYMKEFSPKMVVFENVTSAPWLDKNRKAKDINAGKRGLDWHVEEKGYFCRYIKLDTKQFYLPHTRTRGYMICVRKDLVNSKMDLAEDEAFDKWKSVVTGLGNPATVGVDAFFLAPGDPRVLSLQEGESDIKNARKPIAWSKCKVGHQNYRFVHGYGDNHPLTNWHGESYSLPDHFQRGMKGLTQRVLDTIDIAHLRNLDRGFDDQYYR